MSPVALSLVLSAAVLHALWNFAAKRVPDGGAPFVWLYIALSAGLWVPIASIWSISHPLHPQPIWLVGAAVSAGLQVVYSIVLQAGYGAADMNLVYPLARGTGPLVTMLVSITVLRQRLAPVAVVGALLIVSGVVVIVFGGGQTRGPLLRRSGIAYGVATGVVIAAYTLWDSRSVTSLGIPPLPYFALGLVLQTLLLAPGVWPSRRACIPLIVARWREMLVVATLSPLAYLLVLQAMRLAPVALVAASRETSIVVGSLLSWLVLREPHPARRLVGAAIVLLGIAALVAR